MTPLARGVRAAVFLRSFAVQGSWNYRTLIGAGFAFALLPALRAIHGREPERLRAALQRHAALFNSHPYLAPVALGAVATLEAEGAEAAVVERFKMAVRGSLGTLGDRLIWAGWRPVCLLLAIALLLAGAAWWVGLLAFLGVYNAGHLLLRAWAYRVGLAEGKDVGERLRSSRVAGALPALATAGAFLVGSVLPLAVTGRVTGAALPVGWMAAAAIAAIFGVRFGQTVRTPMIGLLGAAALIGFALGALA